jgi:hypothetical protein
MGTAAIRCFRRLALPVMGSRPGVPWLGPLVSAPARSPGSRLARAPAETQREGTLLQQISQPVIDRSCDRARHATFTATADQRLADDWCDELARVCDDAGALHVAEVLAWLHESPPPDAFGRTQAANGRRPSYQRP